ncbi:NB-ARC domain-containing protein [Kitasatospora sp. MBT63]|uniref:ATP-binding protein n=1 Tax=Kitasatospora sp. MBT63 TaxID=1444768 RepID=UPI0006901BA9|nr:NB-ARC domain-containing protein [Kitasatospora sp. MBT63]
MQDPVRPAGARSFGEELEALLIERQLSWRKLSQRVGYTAGWLSKIKNGRQPSADLARRCDEVLQAGGRLVALAAAHPAAHRAPAPVAAHLVRPAQLPGATAGFVGREAALGQLDAALTGAVRTGVPRVVAIDGPPGVGKTALALRWAHDVAPQFPDGQLYIDLHGYSSKAAHVLPEDVLEKFLVALGVPVGEIPDGTDQRAGLYRSILAGRRILVVLDNAADFPQVEPLLPGSSECVVVVTSRSRLFAMAVRTHAGRVTLEPLSGEESCQLLRTVISPQRADREAKALGELARLCGHLPLALRIVAEQILMSPTLSLGRLLDDLVAEGQLLELLSPDDAIAVRAVFSWSYRQLDEECRRTFRLLSLHPGVRLNRECAAALVGRPVPQTASLLEKLHGMHLLERDDDGWYRLNELLRLYAAERSRADDTAEDCRRAVRRMTDWYVGMVTATHLQLAPFRSSLNWLRPRTAAPRIDPAPFADEVAALRWCDAELPNLVPVTELAAEHGFHETVVVLALRLFDYLILRKPWSTWVATHELAQRAAQETGWAQALGWVKTHLAYAYWWLRDSARCGRLCEEALEILRELGDRCGEGWALEGYAINVRDTGDLAGAYACAAEALEIFREVENHEGQAAALGTLCDIDNRTGRSDTALAAARDSLQISEEIRDYQRQGRSLIRMAAIYLTRGDSEQALRYAELAVDLHRRINDEWGAAEAFARQGDILFELGQKERAVVSWSAALETYGELDDPRVDGLRKALERSGCC